jgi:hypothetical protein
MVQRYMQFPACCLLLLCQSCYNILLALLLLLLLPLLLALLLPLPAMSLHSIYAFTCCIPTASCVGCKSSTATLLVGVPGGSLMPVSSVCSAPQSLTLEYSEASLCSRQGAR